MKKITFLFAFLIGSYAINAQSNCGSSTVITDGTYTVASVNGTAPTTNCANYNPAINPPNAGSWYIYTNSSAQDAVITITSNLPANAGGDTKVSVLQGTCGALACYANNDDVDFGNANYLSTVEFLAAAGQSYYVVFDATWSAAGFDFQVSSSSDIPGAPLAAANPDPVDGSTVFLTETTNASGATVNQYVFTWELPAASNAATGYTFDLGTDNTVSLFTTELAGPSLSLNGLALNSTYFWRITSINAGGETVGAVWSFSTESTVLSTNSLEAEKVLEHFVSNNNLTINATKTLDKIEIYNMVGQIVNTARPNHNTAEVNLNSLNSGIFIAKVSVDGKTQTFKFVK
jgi:predicted secreted protein